MKIYVKVFLKGEKWFEAVRYENNYIVDFDGKKELIEERFITDEIIEKRTKIKKK